MKYKKDYKLEDKFFQFENLRDLLLHSSKKYSDKTAFVTKVKSGKNVEYVDTTYEKLYNEMIYLGTSLKQLCKDDEVPFVALIGDNSYKWCLSYFATVCGAGVMVPLDKLLQEDEIKSCLIRSNASIVFCDRKKYKDIREIADDNDTSLKNVIGLDFKPEEGYCIDELISEGESLFKSGQRAFADEHIDNEKMSLLLFTSGTTEKSKAVMLSNKNLMSCNYGMNLEELFFEDDVNLMILPLHHCYGMSGLITFLSQGMKTAFCDGLKYIGANLKEYKVTVIMSVPLLLENMYKKIYKAIDKEGLGSKIEKGKKIADFTEKMGIYTRRRIFKKIIDNLGGNLRFIINGAAALDPVVSKGFNDFGILTVQGYGLTETAPTIASETYRYLKPGSVGKVMPNVTAKINNPNEEGIGELAVKGENVMLGYYDDEEATSNAIVDGWFLTGDLARFDSEGYLFICGRKKNVIVMKNGKNIYPEELEALINKLPYVSESVIFTRDKLTDVVIWAKIVYDLSYLKENNIEIEALNKMADEDIKHINESLPAYKAIKKYFISDKPTLKTTTQKTKRYDEIKLIEQELEDRKLINS